MKTKTTYLLLLSLTLVLAGQMADASDGDVRPTEGGSLTLREVTSAALANNPSIKGALRKWNAAKARITQAAAWEDPRVSGESRVHRYVDLPPNAFMDQSASIEQAIPITGKNLVRARGANAEAISAYEELRRQQLDVIAATRAAFFRLANAHAQIEINQKNITSMRQIADISRTKFEAGTHSAADVLVAETEASKVLESERDLERQLSEQEAQLNALMNRDAFAPLGAPREVTPKMPEVSPTKLRPLLLELFRDKIIPHAQQAYEANRLNYESGKASFLDWITSQRNLRDLEAMGRQHLTDYQVAVAELEAIVGAEFYPLPDQQIETANRRMGEPAKLKGKAK